MSAWSQLNPRDRRILIGGAVIVLLMLIFAWGVVPLHQAEQRLAVSVPEKRAALAQMRAQAQVLLATAPTVVAIQPIPGSLLSFIDAQARQAGLESALKRLEPVGEEAVRLTFERVEFERLAKLLDQLQQTYGLRPSELSLNADVSPGQVSGQVKLERSGG
jgi:general secretion pathway protein M